MEYLYLIRCDEFIKIGIACDVKNRLKTLQTGSPYPLELIASFEFEDALLVETVLHRKFDYARSRGEWFNLTDAQIDEIANICKNFDDSARVKGDGSFATEVLASALNYCKEAGIKIDIYNEDGKLIIIVPGVYYSRGAEAICPLPESVT